MDVASSENWAWLIKGTVHVGLDDGAEEVGDILGHHVCPGNVGDTVGVHIGDLDGRRVGLNDG